MVMERGLNIIKISFFSYLSINFNAIPIILLPAVLQNVWVVWRREKPRTVQPFDD